MNNKIKDSYVIMITLYYTVQQYICTTKQNLCLGVKSMEIKILNAIMQIASRSSYVRFIKCL